MKSAVVLWNSPRFRIDSSCSGTLSLLDIHDIMERFGTIRVPMLAQQFRYVLLAEKNGEQKGWTRCPNALGPRRS